MDKTEKLKKLIDSAKEGNDFIWLENTQWQNIRVSTRDENNAAPVENMRHTFSVRGKINQSRGNPIKGFETFLRNLETTKTEAIIVHQMTDIDGYEYSIFTDPAIDELIGVLRFVKESEINLQEK